MTTTTPKKKADNKGWMWVVGRWQTPTTHPPTHRRCNNKVSEPIYYTACVRAVATVAGKKGRRGDDGDADGVGDDDDDDEMFNYTEKMFLTSPPPHPCERCAI